MSGLERIFSFQHSEDIFCVGNMLIVSITISKIRDQWPNCLLLHTTIISALTLHLLFCHNLPVAHPDSGIPQHLYGVLVFIVQGGLVWKPRALCTNEEEWEDWRLA